MNPETRLTTPAMARPISRHDDGRQFAMTFLLAVAGAALGLVFALGLHGV